jgi:hypothetical protein
VQALRQAGYDDYAQQVAEAWEAELGRGMRILLPESKPLDACQANLAYLLMSTEIPKQGRPRFHDHLRGLIEPAAQSAAFAQALDESGRPDLARDALEAWLDTQGPDGCLSPEKDADEHCRVLTALIEHAWLTGDRTWAERVYPQVKTAADWLLSAMEADKTPPALSPFLTVEALGEVGEMAALVGKQEDAAIFRAQRDRALATTQTTLASEPLAGAAAPSILGLNRGLPDSPGAGFVSPHAEHVTELCRRLHTSYAEGLATEGGFLSPLLTMELARLHALRGEQEQALRDLYAVLVHTGSCQEGFAGGVRPWADRDSGESWSPDPRFSAAYMGLLRDLLIREQRDELHLFSAWSPEWLQPGKLVGVYNAPTSFGLVTAAMQIEEGGAALVMAADWHAAPSRVVLHLPYCVDVTSVSADRPGLKQDEGPPPSEYEGEDLPAAGSQGATAYLELRPDTTQVTIKWTPRADALLSYESAVEAWQAAYAARYARYLNAGKEPLAVEPIPLR